MRRALVLLPLLLAGSSQTAVPAALPEALRAHVKDERLQVVTSIRGLPLGVRDSLAGLFGTYPVDMAEPTGEFQLAAGRSQLPTRRLVKAGCSVDHCLVYYERGGDAHTWHVLLFHWTPDETRIECGGIAPAGLASIDDVRAAVLSGAIKGPVKVWRPLL